LGAGNDVVTFGSTGGSAITVTAIDLGTAGSDTITINSTAGINLQAVTGAESVYGGSGVDLVTFGNAQSSYFDGGAGSDTATLSVTGITLTVANVEAVIGDAGAADTVIFSGAAVSGMYAKNVESITLTTANDVFEAQYTAPTTTVSNTISTGGGNDTFTLTYSGTSTGVETFTVFLGAGNDTYTMAETVDVGTSTVFIVGGAGADTINLGTGHTGATEIDVVRISLASDVASGTTLANVDVINQFNTASDQLDLTSFTLTSGNGTNYTLQTSSGVDATTNKDDFTTGNRTATGTAATFADLTGTYGQALTFIVTDGASGGFATQAAIDAAVSKITGNMGTGGVFSGQKAIIIVQSGSSNAVFLYQEAGGTGISASELTLIGVVNNGLLAAGNLG